MERAKRFELSTSTLARLHSTTELYPHFYFLGASGRNRTTDTRIFSPLLYRLSYRGIWRRRWGSNPRPPAWQAGILTNWTTAPHWWAMTGSNCRHLACKASALPAELITRDFIAGTILSHHPCLVKTLETENPVEFDFYRSFKRPYSIIHSNSFVNIFFYFCGK